MASMNQREQSLPLDNAIRKKASARMGEVNGKREVLGKSPDFEPAQGEFGHRSRAFGGVT